MARTVVDLMTHHPRTVTPSATAAEVRAIMHTLRVRHVPVVDASGRLAGMISMSDVLTAMQGDGGEIQRDDDPLDQVTAAEIMNPVVQGVPQWTSLLQAARNLEASKRSALPIVDEKSVLVGILTESDFLKVVIHMLEEEAVAADELTIPPYVG